MNLYAPTTEKGQAFYQELINTPVLPTELRTNQPIHKTWMLAKSRCHNQIKLRTNNTVESRYGTILSTAKEYLQGYKFPIFERNYRRDKTESAQAMHCIMSNNLYLLLECDALYNYRIDYAFNNCPFEPEIKKMLIGYPCDTRSAEVKLQPDFITFYHRVLTVQDKKHIAFS